MALSEFDLIKHYFSIYPPQHAYNQLGIGDDCALINIPSDCQLAVTTDTMVENVHFFADVDPESLGHKLLAVNLSDLAAMGAEPFAVTLALTLPKADNDWLSAFSKGFLNLAQQHHVDLIGGDTTAGALTLTVQAMGTVPHGKALLRSTAQVGDLIYVTGNLGSAGLGLKIKQGYHCLYPSEPLRCLLKPQPRISQGLALRDFAHACIDISDGLVSDLGHIVNKSGVGACINFDSLPISDAVRDYMQQTNDYLLPLTAGDDYELCFTIPAIYQSYLPTECVQIGLIESQSGIRLNRSGTLETLRVKGYEHFS